MRNRLLAKLFILTLLTATALLSACSSVSVFEAEDAELFGVSKRIHSEASGGFRVVDFGEVGDYIDYGSVPSGKFLALTYSLGEADPVQCSVYIDDQDAATAVFEPTGSWSNYRTLVLPIAVHGSVRLQVDADDAKANDNSPMASQDKLAIMSRPPKIDKAYGDLINRMAQVLDNRYAPVGDEDPIDWAASLNEDGLWPDLADRGRGLPVEHLRRVREMAAAWRRGGADMADIARTLDAWNARPRKGGQWWSKQIDAPRAMADILVLAGDALPPATRARCLDTIRPAWPMPENSQGFGRNALYRARAALTLGALTGAKPLVNQALKAITNNIRRCRRDGIQVDWSFRQYGVPHTGGYGLEFALEAVDLADMLTGSDFAISQWDLGVVADFVLQGMQPVMRGPAFDPSTLGALIADPSAGDRARHVTGICDHLIALGAPQQAGLKALKALIETNTRIGARPESEWRAQDTRYFWRAGLMAHQTPAAYVSMRMASARVGGTESVGGLNLRGYHLPDGAVWIMRRGNEYGGLFPVMDWRKIPGVTCPQGNDALPVPERDGDDRGSQEAFAGGATDGTIGAAGFDLKRAGLSACKAAFFFEGETVCLGAAIRSKGDAPIATHQPVHPRQPRRRPCAARPQTPPARLHPLERTSVVPPRQRRLPAPRTRPHRTRDRTPRRQLGRHRPQPGQPPRRARRLHPLDRPRLAPRRRVLRLCYRARRRSGRHGHLRQEAAPRRHRQHRQTPGRCPDP